MKLKLCMLKSKHIFIKKSFNIFNFNILFSSQKVYFTLTQHFDQKTSLSAEASFEDGPCSYEEWVYQHVMQGRCIFVVQFESKNHPILWIKDPQNFKMCIMFVDYC